MITTNETSTACQAARRAEALERPPVSERKIGTVPTGSMITKSVTNALVSTVVFTRSRPDRAPSRPAARASSRVVAPRGRWCCSPGRGRPCRAVVVAGPGDHQVEVAARSPAAPRGRPGRGPGGRPRCRPGPLRPARRTPPRSSAVRAVPPPRMGEHRHPAGLRRPADHRRSAGRRSGWRSAGRPGLRYRSNASLRSGDDAEGHQRVGDVRPPGRRRAAAARRTSSSVEVDARRARSRSRIAGTRALRPSRICVQLRRPAAGTSGRAGRRAGARRVPGSGC